MNQPSNVPSMNTGSVSKSTIVAGLYLASFVFGITGLVGLIMAYVWRDEVRGTWEESHITYLIRTFWIGFILSVIGFILTVVLIGIFIIFAAMIQLAVRSVFSIIRAQKKEAMPDPTTLLW